jgi:hypothetical protein
LHFFFGCKLNVMLVDHRHFYLFLKHFPSVIRRLITLLSECARQVADSNAARKQAEGAHRHLETLMADDSKVR